VEDRDLTTDLRALLDGSGVGIVVVGIELFVKKAAGQGFKSRVSDARAELFDFRVVFWSC